MRKCVPHQQTANYLIIHKPWPSQGPEDVGITVAWRKPSRNFSTLNQSHFATLLKKPLLLLSRETDWNWPPAVKLFQLPEPVSCVWLRVCLGQWTLVRLQLCRIKLCCLLASFCTHFREGLSPPIPVVSHLLSPQLPPCTSGNQHLCRHLLTPKWVSVTWDSPLSSCRDSLGNTTFCFLWACIFDFS